MQHRFKCEHTLIDDEAMIQLQKIAMVYLPEFVASPVEDLGCHAMYSQILDRFPNATLSMHETNREECTGARPKGRQLVWILHVRYSQQPTLLISGKYIRRENRNVRITFQHLKLYTLCKI